MASVISHLPEADLRGQATVIAAIYAQIDQAEPPKQLVDLRIGLRASQPHAIDETEQIDTQQIDSSTEESEEETEGRRDRRERRRQDGAETNTRESRTSKKKPGKKAPRLTQKEIGKLSRLPGKAREEQGGTREASTQTLGRRRCVWHGNFHRARPVLNILEEPAEGPQTEADRLAGHAATQTGGRRRSEVQLQDITRLLPEEEAVRDWLRQLRQTGPAEEGGPEDDSQRRSPSLDLTDADRRQLESEEQDRWAEEYERMLQDEEAEAQYAADYQHDLDSEDARAAYERAQMAAEGGSTYMNVTGSGHSGGSSS